LNITTLETRRLTHRTIYRSVGLPNSGF